MCKALKVFESGYFRWKNKGKRAREVEDEILIPKIRAIHEESKRTYGPSRIKTALEKQGIMTASLSRIRRLMKENGIYSITRYKHKPYPKEKVETRYNENIIDREFDVAEPDRAWCGDIAYIKTSTGWVYLAAVIDLFNREVVGYSVSKKANTELAKRAMANALVNRKPTEKLIFHSDRGCQYSSKGYLEYLEEHNVESSMSRKGNPYDNACTESFFATLKKEWIYHRVYKDLDQLDTSLFEYIELFYNRKRMHSSLENLSPREYYLNYRRQKPA
jgi:putative transposase